MRPACRAAGRDRAPTTCPTSVSAEIAGHGDADQQQSEHAAHQPVDRRLPCAGFGIAPGAQQLAQFAQVLLRLRVVEAQPAEIIQLTRDSIILRLIEEGETDRLVWVDESTLGILAV